MKRLFANWKPLFTGIQVFTLIFVLLLSFSVDANAQSGKKKQKQTETDEYFDESGTGAFRFWYGGGVGLGFNNNGQSSQFDFSISPMVGYKITPEFSVGPRVELSYTHFRTNLGSSNVFKTNFLSYGVGLFARYKVFNKFFAHTEYQVESRQDLINFNGDKIRTRFDNFYIGGGYTSGGQVGYEISLLYNLIEQDNTINLPIDYRLAFTYNF